MSIRWTEEQLKTIQGKRTRDAVVRIQSKYRNVPVEIGGERFDSKREAKRWGELKLLEASGEISELARQVKYPLIIAGHHICDYIADFVYVRTAHRVLVVEDTKGCKTAVYRLKKKLMRAIYQIEIFET